MKIILFGATGMVGHGALLEALDDPDVEEALIVVRRPTGLEHAKLVEVVHADFEDFSSIEERFCGYDACLYCVGVSAADVTAEQYEQITKTFTLRASEAMLRQAPGMRMCFVSGTGTDADSRTMWARVKGETEQALLNLPWRSAHMFRPAMIFPRRGVVSGTRSYRIMYAALGWAYPLFKLVAGNSTTTSDQLGRALLAVAKNGHPKVVLERGDINAVSG